jgi:hypothetical protein
VPFFLPIGLRTASTISASVSLAISRILLAKLDQRKAQ